MTINISDRIISVFVPVAIAKGLTDHSDWIASRHRISEFITDRVSEVKAYRNYIKILSLKLGMFLSGKIFN